MVKILKPILLVFIKSKAMKRLIVDLLKAIAKQTDNTIDDQAVAFIEARMFPGSTTSLQWHEKRWLYENDPYGTTSRSRTNDRTSM